MKQVAPSGIAGIVSGSLPGGLWRRGTCRKEFALRSRTGALELEVADAIEGATSLPAAVTAALSRALLHLGGALPSPASLGTLCVVDRQFLLRRLQIHLGQGQGWRHAPCGACGEPFDFSLDLEELPVVPAADGYPFVEVPVEGAQLRFRLPNGS